MGGPNGGDGGKGGDVWLVADRNVASLLAFRDHPHRRAGNGVHGKGKDQHGKRGRGPARSPCPRAPSSATSTPASVLADLVHHGDRWLAAAGGRGGRGNAKFLSNRRRAPSFAEQGEHGEERWLKLELKLDGRRRPRRVPERRQEHLHQPHLGGQAEDRRLPVHHARAPPRRRAPRRRLRDASSPTSPGLIEGASEGRGLGHQFLRHVERARVLCVLVDLAAGRRLPPDEQDAVLLRELGAYRPELLERPRLVVGTKADVADRRPWDGAAHVRRHRRGRAASVARRAGARSWRRPAPPSPKPEGFVDPPAGAGGRRRSSGSATHEFRVAGRAAVAGRRPVRRHRPPRRSPTSTTG